MSIQVSTIPADANSTTGADKRSTYLAKLLAQRSPLNIQAIPSEAVNRLTELRDRAVSRVQELAIPSTKNEEWRFTDLSDLLQLDLQGGNQSVTVGPDEIAPFVLPEAANRLVLVNGAYQPNLSAVAADLPAGLFIGSLAQAASLNPRWFDYFAKQQGAEEVFTALNTASFADAVIIWVPRNQVVELPVHLLFVSASQSTAHTATNNPAILSHPRCLVIAESGSSITLVEDYVAIDEAAYFTNPVTEIWLQGNAEVKHIRIQRDSMAAFHIGKTAVSQAQDSRYTCDAISLGAKLSRHNLEIYQTGEQTETTLNGLTMIQAEQLADTHSAIALTKPHATSRQLHKCIIDDRAHAVFNGKVFVPKAAQLTNAGQLNRNLLLSPKARVDTKPQLEIVADNVKCTHGATVGQLEADEVFYLQSRGIDAASARSLLVHAFAFEIIEQIPIQSLQQKLSQSVTAQIVRRTL